MRPNYFYYTNHYALKEYARASALFLRETRVRDHLSSHIAETENGKPGFVDIKIRIKGGKIINIEIQVHPVKNIGKRLSFYDALTTE
jgi:hypothetical protein